MLSNEPYSARKDRARYPDRTAVDLAVHVNVEQIQQLFRAFRGGFTFVIYDVSFPKSPQKFMAIPSEAPGRMGQRQARKYASRRPDEVRGGAAASGLAEETYVTEHLSAAQAAMVALFQQHVDAELAGDLETTMATMTEHPHLNHVPVMTGGVGRAGVRDFYRDHLVGKFFPPDVNIVNVSRTVGHDQLVEELAINFTHTVPIDWLLPGVAPTGKKIEMAVAVIIGFQDGKISHEHIYWDQAGVLVQAGLLDPSDLPVSGAESARKVVNPRLPSRQMLLTPGEK